MTLLVAWLVLPLLLGGLALGCGLLVERMGAVRLPGALLLPVGAATLILIAQFAAISDTTAELAAPLVLGAAVAGWVVSPPWRRGRIDPWLAGAALFVFACYAAPVVLSGDPTFAGNVKLDDTATWLGQVDRLMEHGRSLDGLAPSTYEAALDSYLPRGSPVGAMFPLGIGSTLLNTDPAWLIQPVMSFFAVMLALALSQLLRPLDVGARSRAAAAAVAAQPALLFGYVMWGGIKEITAAALLALIVATIPIAVDRARVGVLPLTISSGALLATLGPAGGVWLAPMLLGALAIAIPRIGLAETTRRAGLAALGIALLCVPLFTGNAFEAATTSVLYEESELGNLFEPLSKFQAFGIWPVGDFRVSPNAIATAVLIGAALIALVCGVVYAVRERAFTLLVLPAAGLVSLVAIFVAGSPWVDAKALATFSSALLILAMAGALALGAGRARAVGLGLAAVIGTGVLLSNALTYTEVNLAPYDELRELQGMGEDIAGEGPTLMTSYQPYGVRHFLRDGDPEGVSELRRRLIPLRDGSEVEKGGSADTDALSFEDLLQYRTLVLRRSPAQSRPPSPYELVDAGRFYEVWQRPAGPPPVGILHVPLGVDPHPTEPWDCDRIDELVETGGDLAYVARPANVVFALSRFDFPESWGREDSQALFPDSEGTASLTVDLPRAGPWRTWLGGTWRGSVELWIDGDRVARSRHSFNFFQYADLGVVDLGPGPHDVELRYRGSDWRPGSAGPAEPMGPLVFSQDDDLGGVQRIPAADVGDLCGEWLDWIEATPP